MNLELFEPEAIDNLLPCDGQVTDYGLILDTAQSAQYLKWGLGS